MLSNMLADLFDTSISLRRRVSRDYDSSIMVFHHFPEDVLALYQLQNALFYLPIDVLIKSEKEYDNAGWEVFHIMMCLREGMRPVLGKSHKLSKEDR